jgi:hypothetical protein
MLMTLLKSNEDLSFHYEAGRVVGMVVAIAVMLILVVAVIKFVIKKTGKRS